MSQEDQHRNRIFCEVVAQLIISDGAVTDAERDFLYRLMDRFGFDENDRSAVINSVDIGQRIDHRLAQLDAASRVQLLAELEAVANVDGEIGAGEQQIIEEVRKALG